MKNFSLIAIIVLLITWHPLPSHAQQDFRPVDQAVQQPEFFVFRANLQTAIARRDVKSVLGVLHKDVKNSFGGEGGIQEFKQIWRPGAADSKLWSTLAAVLALGGTFESGTTFTAPYVFSSWPQDLGGYEHIAVVAQGVRIRAQPKASAQVLESRSFSILPLGDVEDWEAPWLQVRIGARRVGYVDRRFVRSPIDYRAIFEKRDGRWQMTALVAGD